MHNSAPDPMTCGTDELVSMAREVPDALWPPSLKDLVDLLEKHFARREPASDARQSAAAVALFVAESFGGASYLPGSVGLRRAVRNIRICEAFKGGANVAELATRYRICEVHVRSIVRRREFYLGGAR